MKYTSQDFMSFRQVSRNSSTMNNKYAQYSNSDAKVTHSTEEKVESLGLYFLTVVLLLLVTFSMFKLEIMAFLMAKFL